MLIEDTISATPSFTQPPLSDRHAASPFGSTNAVRRWLADLVREGLECGTQLWRALLARDVRGGEMLLAELEPHHLELCVRWRLCASPAPTRHGAQRLQPGRLLVWPPCFLFFFVS